ITNIGDRCLVDMLDNRRKVTIVEFLRSLPNPEKIQAASTDMYRPYREAIQEVLPHVLCAFERFLEPKQALIHTTGSSTTRTN
ncbi:MAG: transposase, partial [Betaproteobacteria bacterium]|nr:transposase [Betaproteobacteria bacterium]